MPSIASGFVAALYFTIILPAQTYLACVEAPQFSLGDLLSEFGLYFCLMWVVLVAVLFALSYVPLAKATIDAKGRRHRKISLQFHVFVIAVVIAAIMESGPLSIGLPKLNGDFAGYRSSVRSWFDALAMAAIVITPLACYRWLKHYVTWLAVAVALYGSLALVDVSGKRISVKAGNDIVVHADIPRYDVVAQSAFSPSNNVMVLILDTVSSHAAAEILRTDPEFAQHFPGFVNYVNNLGMHWTTAVALPGIMTGRHFESSADLATYGMTPFTGESFIKDYIDSDIPVYLNLGMWPQGWSNRIAASKTGGTASRPSQVIIDDTLELRIGDLALFRIVPYCLKERLALAVASRSVNQASNKDSTASRGNVYRDETAWPLLASRPVDNAFRSALHVHHTTGGHPPFTRDENGNVVNLAEKEPTFSDYVSHCKFALKKLADCFDVWQTNGVYDASTIIVISDHGVGTAWPETKPFLHDIPSYAFPSLMVKTRGDRTPYTESLLTSSHAKVAPLVRALAKEVLSRERVAEILHTEKRFCRSLTDGFLTDWVVSGDWTVQKVVQQDVQKDASALRKLMLDKTYSFRITAPPEDYPDYIVDNGNRGSSNGLSAMDIKKPLKLSFKAPAANTMYDVMLRVEIHQNPEGNIVNILARCGSATASFMSDKPTGGQNYLMLKGCKSGEDGIVNIETYYLADPKRAGKFYFNFADMRLARHMSENLVENDFFPGNVSKSTDLLQCWRVDATFTRVVSDGASLSGYGNDVSISSPRWFLKNGGQGVSVEGRSLEGKFKLVCKGEGDIVIALLGVNRTVKNSQLRVYADFESFKINGKEMLESPVQARYGSGFKIPVHVTDGEELNVSVQLKRHKYSYIELRNLLLDAQKWTLQTEQSVDGCLALPAMQEFLSN